MPRGDGTGPRGVGAMTGRARGFCAGFSSPGDDNGWGLGAGFCRRFGGSFRSRRFVGNPPALPAGYSENSLQGQMTILCEEIKNLQERLRQGEKEQG
ncbi:MAG: DUF5320 domain-containing protein [Deltaproteobacteria bacterium]|nr:DUF5320 domain-containing protein [Deltaproteobacteria bacterium]